MSVFVVSYIALWIVALFQLLVILFLAQKLEQLRSRLEHAHESPEGDFLPGAIAPSFSAAKVGSAVVVDSMELVGKPTVFLFLSVTCADCASLARGLGSLDTRTLEGLVVYCAGGTQACSDHLAGLADKVMVLTKRDTDLVAAFGVASVPTAVLVDSHWRVSEFRSPTSHQDIVAAIRDLKAEAELASLYAAPHHAGA